MAGIIDNHVKPKYEEKKEKEIDMELVVRTSFDLFNELKILKQDLSLILEQECNVDELNGASKCCEFEFPHPLVEFNKDLYIKYGVIEGEGPAKSNCKCMLI